MVVQVLVVVAGLAKALGLAVVDYLQRVGVDLDPARRGTAGSPPKEPSFRRSSPRRLTSRRS